jgi:transcriptional regulator with XRE-family HTH domain
MRTVGEYVRHWRRAACLTRHQLARRAGVRYSYVCQIERNRAGLPREHQLRVLAAVLAPSAEDARMLLDLAHQTRVPAHVVHAVLRQNPSVAALLWWLRDQPLPGHGGALMQQLMVLAHPETGIAAPRRDGGGYYALRSDEMRIRVRAGLDGPPFHAPDRDALGVAGVVRQASTWGQAR